jgi:outer membrane protein assembly factor BamB
VRSERKINPQRAGVLQANGGKNENGSVTNLPAKRIFKLILFLLLSVSLLPHNLLGEDWPEFRGPGGQGHSAEKGLPISWSESKNIAWKADIPGLGWSSPVIQGERIWLTTALDEGRSLRVLCLDRNNGKIIQNIEVFHKESPPRIHTKNSHASPTPILEGERVYVHFGTNGTACLTTDGRVLWKTELSYQHGHGAGGSPVLLDDLLIINCDGTDVQYVVALDKLTGNIRWKRSRQGRMAYATPLAIRVNDVDQIVSPGADRVVAYNPRNGEEIWWARYDGYSLVPRPVYGLGLVFVCSGYDSPTLFAVKPDGQGDVTESRVVWTLRRAAPLNPSPLLIEDALYIVSDKGIASCLEAKTGKIRWQERLSGEFTASPLYADGHIYLLNEEGETSVIAPGQEYKKLAGSSLEGRTLASLAVSGQAIYLRTDHHLYRIQEAK